MEDLTPKMTEYLNDIEQKKQLERAAKYLENLSNMIKFEIEMQKTDIEVLQVAAKVTMSRVTEIIEKYGTAK